MGGIPEERRPRKLTVFFLELVSGVYVRCLGTLERGSILAAELECERFENAVRGSRREMFAVYADKGESTAAQMCLLYMGAN